MRVAVQGEAPVARGRVEEEVGRVGLHRWRGEAEGRESNGGRVGAGLLCLGFESRDGRAWKPIELAPLA